MAKMKKYLKPAYIKLEDMVHEARNI